jgi:hypothetical protein
VALLFSITPNLPGLIGNINPRIKVGNTSRLFDIAWLYGVRNDLLLFNSVPHGCAHASFSPRLPSIGLCRRCSPQRRLSSTERFLQMILFQTWFLLIRKLVVGTKRWREEGHRCVSYITGEILVEHGAEVLFISRPSRPVDS